MYVARFGGSIRVLHCFRKKTQATSKQDKAITATRYRPVVSAKEGMEMKIDTEIRPDPASTCFRRDGFEGNHSRHESEMVTLAECLSPSTYRVFTPALWRRGGR